MSKKKTESFENTFRKAIKRIASLKNVLEADVSKTIYYANREETEPSEWQLRQTGGFAQVMKLFYPKEVSLLDTSASKHIRAYKNKIDKKHGDTAFMYTEFIKAVSEKLDTLDFKFSKPQPPRRTKHVTERSIVASVSDTHYGANINRSEMAGLNEFNWLIASRRTAFFFEQLALYKPQYRSVTDLTVCLNGDIIAGVIHDQEWHVDLLTTQFAGAVHILAQGLSWIASEYRTVTVRCEPGNHGRSMHKTSKSRASTHKWDSYETMIYIAIKNILERNHTNLKVEVTQAPYTVFDIFGNKFLQTHGDTVINVGNPGKALNMHSINDQINKINASDSTSEKLSGVILGHVHVPTIQKMENGCTLVINGCLSGLDPFAQSIGIWSGAPTQVLFESTKGHPIGDIRMVQVDAGDDEKALDKIITPFTPPF